MLGLQACLATPNYIHAEDFSSSPLGLYRKCSYPQSPTPLAEVFKIKDEVARVKKECSGKIGRVDREVAEWSYLRWQMGRREAGHGAARKPMNLGCRWEGWMREKRRLELL